MGTIISAFAKASGKTEEECKAAYDKAFDAVVSNNPEVEKSSEKFYKLLIGELKQMLSIKTENDGGNPSGGISYSDVAPGTTAGLTTYHTQKRKLKKTVSEAFDRIPMMSRTELGVFSALQNEGSKVVVTMLEDAISSNQLSESIAHIKIGETVDTSISEELMYLDSSIKKAIADKQNFADFIECFVGELLSAANLNEDGFEYPGYDLQNDGTYISVKSSSTRHNVNEAFRNSNSIKSSALILAALHRYNPEMYKEKCSFADITELLTLKDELLQFVESEDSKVRFVISFLNKDNALCTHMTQSVSEAKVLQKAFNRIETQSGKARNKFFSSFSRLVEFCGGEEVTTVKLMNDSEYAALRENIINTISNIKDYELMRKIEMLLR